MRPIILASASPRRRELFGLLNLPFVVWSADVDETPRPGESPELLVARLSGTKAAAIREDSADWDQIPPDVLIVAADTVVVLGERILGKPQDAPDAVRMLTDLRARSHFVHSAVTVVDISSGRASINLSSTRVWMRDYTDEELEAYVATLDPLDKAGAYAIQHAGFAPVDHIEGCYTNVVGLPLGGSETLRRGTTGERRSSVPGVDGPPVLS
jgi:septum formation protein